MIIKIKYFILGVLSFWILHSNIILGAADLFSLRFDPDNLAVSSTGIIKQDDEGMAYVVPIRITEGKRVRIYVADAKTSKQCTESIYIDSSKLNKKLTLNYYSSQMAKKGNRYYIVGINEENNGFCELIGRFTP